MMVAILVVTGLLIWAGVTLLIDAWHWRHLRPDLVDRLAPYQPTVADDAERWLHRQG
jgi:hypothetical protein